MSSNITLSAGVRANLLSLQNTAQLMETTQNRLATGKKVNSALDNPLNYFTSQALQSRAGDLSSLLDSMSVGIQTIQAANNGLTSITQTVQSMQSTLNQARQDKSFQTTSYDLDSASITTTSVHNLTFSGGAVSGSVNVALNTADTSATAASETGTVAFAADTDVQALAGHTITLTAGSNTTTYSITGTSTKAALTAALGANGFTVSFDGSNHLAISRADGANFTVNAQGATDFGVGASSSNGVLATTGTVKTVDDLVTAINGNASLTGKVVASNDSGKLRIQNLSTTDLSLVGVNGTSGDIDGSTGAGNTATIGGNDVRKNLINQFNSLRDQLDKLADDSVFNGVNLLRGDNLKITLNESGSSTINIQAKKPDGTTTLVMDSAGLGITAAGTGAFDSDASISAFMDQMTAALSTLRTQTTAFGSNLSSVQTRQDFTKNMINTLQTGADGLVLADTNEEGANLLALQTRQSLSSTALSMAAQADQNVLRLFQ